MSPNVRVKNNSQEKLTILRVPHVGFLCYLDSEEIYGRWWENKELIHLLPCNDFIKFDVENQSEV